MQNATEIVERIAAGCVAPVDDAGDAVPVCEDVAGVEVAVYQAAGPGCAQRRGVVLAAAIARGAGPDR